MSDLLKILAPNTIGATNGPAKGGTKPDQAPDTAAKPSTSLIGSDLMPIQDPQAWSKMGAGNFMPGQTSKGGLVKAFGGGGGK